MPLCIQRLFIFLFFFPFGSWCWCCDFNRPSETFIFYLYFFMQLSNFQTMKFSVSFFFLNTASIIFFSHFGRLSVRPKGKQFYLHIKSKSLLHWCKCKIIYSCSPRDILLFFFYVISQDGRVSFESPNHNVIGKIFSITFIS